MKRASKIKILLLLILAIGTASCTEQYVLQTNTFEDALVVEATITNELKTQQIKISRTYRFEENGPTRESGATVYITDNNGMQYDFEEGAHAYLSINPFEAVAGKTYRLNVITSDGKSYHSDAQTLTTVNEIESVVPTVQIRSGVKGVAIHVNSFDANGTSKYYRYEYEETYQIVAPKWDASKAIRVPGANPGDHDEIELVPRDSGETRICYSTVASAAILQTNTTSQSEDRVNYPVRFIGDQNPIIANRYSILVRQYIQSLAAYTFYKTLNELSGSESILTQNQPGFFYGNITASENPENKVIGFFEVSSVSSQRIFFNYTDLFPGQQLPPYFVDCEDKLFKLCFSPGIPECKGNELLSAISGNTLLYANNVNDLYYMVVPPCGDCTTFSSNVVPDFWE